MKMSKLIWELLLLPPELAKQLPAGTEGAQDETLGRTLSWKEGLSSLGQWWSHHP